MSKQTPTLVLVARIFGVYFILTFGVSLFWNGLAWFADAGVMFPLNVVFGVAAVMTVLTIVVGWTTSTVGSQILLKDDPEFQKWKSQGGRPYWDFIGWPVNEWQTKTRPPSQEKDSE